MKKFTKYFTLLALVMLVTLVTFISCEDKIELAKADFWVDFKAAVTEEVAVDVALVTYANDDITVKFVDGVEVQEVKDAAEGLFAALGDLVDSGKLTLDSQNKKTFNLDDDDVVVKVARHLLDGTGAGEFLDGSGKVTSPYTAKVKYKGVDFDLKGKLTFDIAD